MNKKKVIIVLLLVCVTLVGGTLAYFNSRHTSVTSLSADIYQTRVSDTFTSPENFVPGTYIERDMKLTNTGDIKVAVRASIEESWTSANGDDLSLTQEIQNTANKKKDILPTFLGLGGLVRHRYARAVLFNTDESSFSYRVNNSFDSPNWQYLRNTLMEDESNENSKDYYYYNYFVNPGESTSPLISSILFNEFIQNEYSCSTNEGVDRCISTGNGYDGATYTLTVTFETVQYDKYQEYWDAGVSIIDEPYHTDDFTHYTYVDNGGYFANKEIDLSNKSINITNDSDVPVVLRAILDEKWVSNGNELEADGLVSFNFIDSDNWIKDDNENIFYYQNILLPGGSLTSFIESIEYNEAYGCYHRGMYDESYCVTPGVEFSNATYNLDINFEIVDYNYSNLFGYNNYGYNNIIDSFYSEDDITIPLNNVIRAKVESKWVNNNGEEITSPMNVFLKYNSLYSKIGNYYYYGVHNDSCEMYVSYFPVLDSIVNGNSYSYDEMSVTVNGNRQVIEITFNGLANAKYQVVIDYEFTSYDNYRETWGVPELQAPLGLLC